MVYLVLAVVVLGTISGLSFRQSWRKERTNRLRDEVRLRAIEAQMAGLRAALRIGVAEHATRRRMHQRQAHDLFANSTLHEEPEKWR